jgi:cobalt-zinc-cadmium efflux system protein
MFADTVSSVVIIIGALVVSLTNWYFIDPLLGIGISILIFVWAWSLLKDSINVLLETAPKGMDVDTIGSVLREQIPEITQITDMHIWEITSGMCSLTVHLEAVLTDGKAGQILDRINKLLDEKYGIEHTTIQIEPAPNRKQPLS